MDLRCLIYASLLLQTDVRDWRATDNETEINRRKEQARDGRTDILAHRQIMEIGKPFNIFLPDRSYWDTFFFFYQVERYNTLEPLTIPLPSFVNPFFFLVPFQSSHFNLL